MILIFSLFPLYVYSVSQISSISLQVFLIVLFFMVIILHSKSLPSIVILAGMLSVLSAPPRGA